MNEPTFHAVDPGVWLDDAGNILSDSDVLNRMDESGAYLDLGERWW